VVVAVLLRLLALLLAADRQQVVGQRELDVLLVDPGQLGGERELLVGLADVEAEIHALARPAAQAAAREVVEQPVDLAAEAPERVVGARPASQRAATRKRHE
jgi:hypothetical protein